MMAWADAKLAKVFLSKPEVETQAKQKEGANGFRGRAGIAVLVRHAV